MKVHVETAFTFQGYFKTTTKTWAVFDMQWPIKTNQKVLCPQRAPLQSSHLRAFVPHVATSTKPAFPASSAMSHVPLSSLPGSWFTSFKMPFPTFIHLSWACKAIKFLRALIFNKYSPGSKKDWRLMVCGSFLKIHSESFESCHSFALRTGTTTLHLGWSVC